MFLNNNLPLRLRKGQVLVIVVQKQIN